MLMTTVVTMLCTAGIAFYVRFFFALCKDCKPRSIAYWMRLRVDSGEDATAELKERKQPVTRAA